MSDEEKHAEIDAEPATEEANVPSAAEKNEPENEVDRVPVYVPGPGAVDITPDKDGGVTKEILKPGTGDEGPLSLDTVYVHYVGSLTDGTKFDSSRDRGEMFEFTLGKGSVIKAWDLAVATMKRGELCVIQCTADYGYGKKGSKPKIPPNATLVFEIELFNWKGEDITEASDGGILKSLLVEGEGYQTPRDMATCTAHVVGKLGNRTFEDRDVTFIVGEAEEAGVNPGVEQTLKKSKKGEKSRVVVKAEYGYGSKGNSELEIPPNADLEYEIELKSFDLLKDSWQLDNIADKLELGENLKNKGTDFFKAGNFKRALKYYKKIVEYLKGEEKLDESDMNSRNHLLVAAHLNMAMCHLKLQDNIEACHSCDSALAIDPKNEKGLFRRGTANLNLRNYEEAASDFKAVLDQDPQNKAAKNQQAIALHKIKQIREHEKKTYAGMFDRFAHADARKAETVKVWKDEKENKSPDSPDDQHNEQEPKQGSVTESGDHTSVTA